MKKIQAKKEFGQNFLKDKTVINKIIQAIPKHSSTLVEIGPGLGDLTTELVKYKDVIAYEIDSELYTILEDKFSSEIQSGTLKLYFGDVIKTWQKQGTLCRNKYSLVANLPYYIATNIILRALEDTQCGELIVMTQKEVAQKFLAKVGQKEYNSLGVMAELVCDVRHNIIDVPPESFDPPPKVESSVFYIKKSKDIALDIKFKKFLKVCFSQPRKKLLKNLTSIYNKDFIVTIFKELAIDENSRPHETHASLYRHIFSKVIQNEQRNK